MARPDSAGACQSGKAGAGGGVLQLGRRPGLSGFGGPALDVGRGCLLQDPGIQAGVRERAVLPQPQRGPAGRTATSPSPDCAENTASILATCRRCRWRIDGPAEIEPTPVVCSSAMQPALDKSVVRCSTKDRAIAGAVTETASRNAGVGGNRRGGTR